MKNFFYFFITVFMLNSCVKVEDSRPPTEYKPLPDTAPAYIAPVCTPPINETTSALGHFELEYGSSSTTHYVQLDHNTLTLNLVNSNNDEVKIILYPFKPKQSTVYKCVGSDNLSAYESFIEFYAYAFNPFNKYLAESMSTPATTLNLKYNATNNTYEMTFCNTKFIISRKAGNTTTISGCFKFKI